MGYFDSSLVLINAVGDVVLLPRMLVQAVLDALHEEFPSDEFFGAADRKWSKATVSGDTVLLGEMLAGLPHELPPHIGIAVRKYLSGERVGIEEFSSVSTPGSSSHPVAVEKIQKVEGGEQGLILARADNIRAQCVDRNQNHDGVFG